jgi:hypothetical protein
LSPVAVKAAPEDWRAALGTGVTARTLGRILVRRNAAIATRTFAASQQMQIMALDTFSA